MSDLTKDGLAKTREFLASQFGPSDSITIEVSELTRLFNALAALEEQLRWRVWMDEPPPNASDLVVVTHEDGVTWHAAGMAATIKPTKRCLWRPLNPRRER